jgi:hypothetical protein
VSVVVPFSGITTSCDFAAANPGWPVADAPRSITVAADTCVQAGMLSTLAMLEGIDAEGFLEAQDVKFWCSRGPAAA